jgi:hypothetical protein
MNQTRREHVVVSLSVAAIMAVLAAPPELCAASDDSLFTPGPASASVPNDVTAAIKAAAYQPGEVVVVKNDVDFDGQIIKADDIVFHPGARLRFTSRKHKWVALVAKRLLVVDPTTTNRITATAERKTKPEFTYRDGPRNKGWFNPNWRPIWEGMRYITAPAQPKKQNKGDDGIAGQHGTNGWNGIAYWGPDAWQNGRLRADDGINSPVLYIISTSLQNQQGEPQPKAQNFLIDLSGQPGQHGPDGTPGRPGGQGGDGGDGEYDVIKGCTKSAGNGGPGGNAGGGGDGFHGGNGGDAGDLFVVGPSNGTNGLLDSFKYAIVFMAGGDLGTGGLPGTNPQAKARGGARGAHPGTCSGGNDGAKGALSNRRPAHGKNGEKRGKDGKYFTADWTETQVFDLFR